MMLLGMKLAAFVLLTGAVMLLANDLVARPDSAPNLAVRRYLIHLDTSLYEMQMPPRGWMIAIAQAVALVVTAFVAANTGGNPWCLVAALGIAAAPQAWLIRTLKQRRTEIELQLNGFNIALANALRASPSLGKALKRAEDVAQGALAEELGIVLRELRLGSSVDQALLNLATRVGSPTLDAVISSLLIGRQIGGRIPDILESTAETLREMERLEGVIRTKTSEAKGQLWVMALAPAVIFYVFDHMQPGYFDPLTQSFAGILVLGGAILAWGAAIVTARKILALEI
jgi:tight adherence protein B